MRSILGVTALLWGFVAVCPATVYVVEPDGSGDFPTIQAAVVAVTDGDIIELTDGIFAGYGNRDLDYLGKSITIRSRSGDPAACTIDCGGSPGDPHRGCDFHSAEGPDAVLADVTIRNGYLQGNYPQGCGAAVLCRNASPTLQGCILTGGTASSGGGLHCSSSAAPTVEACIFADNIATSSAGGMYCSGAVAPSLSDCVFSGNSAASFGGAFYCTNDATPSLDACVFLMNSAANEGGGLRSSSGALATMTGCTFIGNTSGLGGAVSCYRADCVLSGCTLYGNAAIHFGSGISCVFSSSAAAENCIIAGGTSGDAVHCATSSSAVMVCCDVYGNVDGDWVSCIADQLGIDGNICEDPLFCDPGSGDLHLHCDSPCQPFSPPNPECDLIGAWPVGCGASPSSRTTWGGLKHLYRR